jgi:hypothetical protein
MFKFFTLYQRKLFNSALIFLTILTMLTAAGQTFASSQEPGEVEALDPAMGSGQAIQSQETLLDAAYFEANGSLDGLTATPAGLALASGQSSGSYTSEAVSSPLAYTTDIVPLWGADIPEGAQVKIETRLQDSSGAWGEWAESPEMFYPVREDLRSGNLIWVGQNGTAIQLRVTLQRSPAGQSPVLNRVIFAFSDTSEGPSDAEIAGLMPEAEAAHANTCPAKPNVVSRKQWGAPYSHRAPVYQSVTHVIFHQSETPNSTQPYQDYAGWVRSIWNFHARILGWGDIGYNFLIDPNGVIYEGRAGGNDVVGIHDGYNRGSMGVGMIGCYGDCDDPRLSVAEVSDPMFDSAVHLSAWKLGQKGIDPLSAGSYAHKQLPVIAGGRDVTWTTSPGHNVYELLPEIREGAAGMTNCSPGTPTPTPTPEEPLLLACFVQDIIFDKTQYNVGDTINVTVRLVDGFGVPLPGAQVTSVVEKEVEINQAPTGFGFVDRVGEYDGVYDLTDVAGAYQFIITATDPTGQIFAPCSASEVVLVVDGTSTTPTPGTPTPGTPTPGTPTATPTSTATPTATPTTEPTSNVITFDPLNLDLTGGSGTNAVVVRGVDGLTAIEFEVAFNPDLAHINAVDLNDLFEGTNAVVARNEIDNEAGRYFFAAALLAPNEFNGDVTIVEIDWESSSSSGGSQLRLDNVTMIAGTEPIDAVVENGTLVAGATTVSGAVTLQGRSQASGVTVSSDNGGQTQTDTGGAFTIAGNDMINFEFPGYLAAQASILANLQAQGEAFSAEGSASLGTITLRAGDVNNDDQINILDLAYMATHYQGSDATADLNGDGTVNILDLALAAGNYGQQGPVKTW